MMEDLLCRRTDVHVDNLEFRVSLIPATNSHRTRNVAHVAEGFSRESIPSTGVTEFMEINRRQLCFATLVDRPSCEIRHLNPPLIATVREKNAKVCLLYRTVVPKIHSRNIHILIDIVSHREFKISKHWDKYFFFVNL